MNEQIQQEILKYLQAFSAGIEKAGTFTAEQAPLVVQEFLRWEIVSNLLSPVILTSIIIFIFKKIIPNIKNYGDKSDEELAYGVFYFLCIIFFIFCLSNLFGLSKTIVAPRIVVIEKISELTRGAR